VKKEKEKKRRTIEINREIWWTIRYILKEKRNKKEKKIPDSGTVEFHLSSSVVTPSASSPICLHLLGRFGASVWWCWSPPVTGDNWCASGHPVIWWVCAVAAW
jgi:hypothetical protein